MNLYLVSSPMYGHRLSECTARYNGSKQYAILDMCEHEMQVLVVAVGYIDVIYCCVIFVFLVSRADLQIKTDVPCFVVWYLGIVLIGDVTDSNFGVW